MASKRSLPNIFIDTALLPKSTLRSSNVQLTQMPQAAVRSCVGKAFRHSASGSQLGSASASQPGSPMSSRSAWDSLARSPGRGAQPDSPFALGSPSASQPGSPQSPLTPWEHYRPASQQLSAVTGSEAFEQARSMSRVQLKKSQSSSSLTLSSLATAEDLPDGVANLDYAAAVKLFNVWAFQGGAAPYLERKPFRGMLHSMKLAGQILTKHDADAIFDALGSNQSGRISKSGFLRWVFQADRQKLLLKEPLMIEFCADDTMFQTFRWMRRTLRLHYSTSQVAMAFVQISSDVICLGSCKIVAKLGRGVVLWDRVANIAFEQDPFADSVAFEQWFQDVFLEAVSNLLAMATS